MPTKAGTGFSQNVDSAKAGAEACKKAMVENNVKKLTRVFNYLLIKI